MVRRQPQAKIRAICGRKGSFFCPVSPCFRVCISGLASSCRKQRNTLERKKQLPCRRLAIRRALDTRWRSTGAYLPGLQRSGQVIRRIRADGQIAYEAPPVKSLGFISGRFRGQQNAPGAAHIFFLPCNLGICVREETLASERVGWFPRVEGLRCFWIAWGVGRRGADGNWAGVVGS